LKLSVIVPCLNEGEGLYDLIDQLQSLRQEGHEVILVDASEPKKHFKPLNQTLDKHIFTQAGRAYQMNQGANQASGDILWFVHADSRLSKSVLHVMKSLSGLNAEWGRFCVRLDAQGVMFRTIEWMMNMRSCMSSIATGDQAIYVSRDLFHELKGFPDIALMEDIALSGLLKKKMRLTCHSETIETSARRWKKNGVYKTILLMWLLRWQYFWGADPVLLARRYLN